MVTITNTTAWRYLRYIGPNNGFCNVAEIEFYKKGEIEVKQIGTAFGTSPAYKNGTSTFDKAFDNNIATFFDFANANGGYTGIDVGAANARKVIKIRFFPRAGFEGRMNGGKFQGSNTSSSSGFTDLYTLPAAPLGGMEHGERRQWHGLALPAVYRAQQQLLQCGRSGVLLAKMMD